MTARDTIFALASGHGRAAIAVIRLSGPDVRHALARLLGGPLPAPRRASLRRLRDPASGEILDQALVLWMPGPGSFTGEDQAELHIHGGLAVRAALIGALGDVPGCRPAEPGEFTRRAFLGGRLDLTAVEGLGDLIDAETEAQRRQAVRQLEGRLATQVATWRDALIESAASLEAALDFTDEEDIPADVTATARRLMAAVSGEVATTLADNRRGERLREGAMVVIAGPPNAGKSTLLNALARRDVAIVSPRPGTTRDAIEVRCDLGGVPVTFVDTAGLRETEDPIEHAGIARTRAHLGGADLVLWLRPAGESGSTALGADPGLVGASGVGDPARTLTLLTKADLVPGFRAEDGLAVSAATGEGMAELVERIRLAVAGPAEAGDALITRERHRRALGEVADALGRADAMLLAGHDELAAEDLRLALRALGRITGHVDVEEVLDRIFGQFCIGK